VDAIHFDDYFYPYRIAGKEFPDNASYLKYGKGMSRDDWRRSNVDSIIVMLGKAIKAERETCKFGISPFGIWRNIDKDSLGSNTKAGQTNYDDLFADILLWLKEGWIDYVAPQLYFEFGHRAAPYEVLLDWWSRHTYGRHCYIGLAMYRANSNAAWRDKSLLPREIAALREAPNVQGMIFFSSKSFENNPNGWDDSLQNNYFRSPALVPPMAWMDTATTHEPIISISYNKKDSVLTTLLRKAVNDEEIKGFAVYETNDENFINQSNKILAFVPFSPKAVFSMKVKSIGRNKKPAYFFATAVGRNNVESKPVFLYSFASPAAAAR
ncbi:MAG: family 10 glycosylhydrolase, partial [Bacteroidetes bacterium]|nr:family 10 glycosylhydrolase [Bacteroidota bacterium]